MKKRDRLTAAAGLILSFYLILAGCSGKGVGGSSGGGAGTTVVTGKVTLSSSIVGLGKPSLTNSMVLQSALLGATTDVNGQPTVLADTSLLKKLNAPLYEAALAYAEVDMYDANHAEWLYPVSSGSSDANGDYTLSSMTNASKNAGSTYADGDPIPAGNYTLVAYSGFGLGQKPIVAVQSIVKSFEGDIPNVDFEVLPSDVSPEVIHMFGTRKITDGTERWGFDDTGVKATLPANSAIQLSFSLPMWRDSMKTGIVIDPPVAGKWSLSADWLTATYYLDPGVQLTPGQEYAITINGEDSDPNLPRALNVYGNALKLTATGKFLANAADTIEPTVQWNSPTVIEMGGAVDVTQSFRIESNKPLDVNGITFNGTGTTSAGDSVNIGVKPGVLFLGKTSGGLYVYEFLLGEPLQLNTSYRLAVSGGKDLAGHRINMLTGSVTTKDAANTPGIDPNAAPEVQNLQAQVKSVFGKWARAMNDRNIAQWQSVMSGEFYMEYDVASKGIDRNWDLNRDGRYSFGEYSRQLVSSNFPLWEYCGSSITGSITPTEGQYINVNPLTNTADFDFKLSVSNETNLNRCVSAAPKETFYMTLKFKNGSWKIVRGSIGIDTRDKEINKPNFISETKLTQSVYPFFPILNDTEIADGGLLSLVPDNDNLKAKYTWNAAAGVSVYLLIVADERTPSKGFAIAFPSTVLGMSTADDLFAGLKGIDIGTKIGFSAYANFKPVIGGKYRWEVVGLGTATATPDASNPNDPNYVGNKTSSDLIRDISAVSSVRRYGIGGIYAELTAEVRAGSSASGTPVVYSPAISGYDLGSAWQATVTIYTPNLDVPTATLTQTAAARKTYNITFTDRKATVTVPLYYGSNSFSFVETNVPVGKTALTKSFQVLTLNGKQPPISIWEVSDNLGNILSGDEWNYYRAPGASKVRVLGSMADPSITSIDWSLSNSSGSIAVSSRGTIDTDGSPDNLFSTASMTPQDIEIYPGNNSITLYKYLYTGGTYSYYYRTSLIVYTDTGSVWTPPITISSIAGGGTTTVTKTADYGTSADWNAVPDAAANYTVTVSGMFKNPATGRYYVSSDGGYVNGNITPDGSGNFSFDVLLWQGWSYISINDSQNNWYYLNIKAENGKIFNKPTITRIDGNAYDPVASQDQFADTNCSATIEGTADPGMMYVYWNGSTSTASYSEYQDVQNTNGTFRFPVPLVGPGGTNNVNIYDVNNRRSSITITTTGVCSYSPPSFTVTAVKNASGALITPTGTDYSAGSTNTITVEGSSNREGAQILLRSSICNQDENYKATTAADGSWSIPNIKVYGLAGANGWNYVNLSMSNAYTYFSVISTNTNAPVLRMNLTSVTGNVDTVNMTGDYCGQTYWNAGSNNTALSITGTTLVQSGNLRYRDSINQEKTVQIVNGAFAISNTPIYKGSDNSISIYNNEDPLGYSSHYLSVTSSNNNLKPRFVTITSPAVGTDGLTGTQTVSGTIVDTIGSGFSGANGQVYAQVYACGMWTNFTNDTWMQTNYGYGPATLTDSSFSFTADFCGVAAPEQVQVYVNVYDSNTGASHYHSVLYNDGASTPSENWSKARLQPSGQSGLAQFIERDAARRAFRMLPK